MGELPDNYEDQEGLAAQPDYMDAGQDPKIQEDITKLQDTFHDQEMGIMDGNHLKDMQKEEMQPPAYSPEGMETGAENTDEFALPPEETEFTGTDTKDTFNLDMPAPAATEEEPEPEAALPSDEEKYEKEGGAPGGGFGA